MQTFTYNVTYIVPTLSQDFHVTFQLFYASEFLALT